MGVVVVAVVVLCRLGRSEKMGVTPSGGGGGGGTSEVESIAVARHHHHRHHRFPWTK